MSRLVVLLVGIACFIAGGMTFKLVISLALYGTLAGPCVWASDAVMMGVDLSTLEWSVPLQCYLHPSRDSGVLAPP